MSVDYRDVGVTERTSARAGSAGVGRWAFGSRGVQVSELERRSRLGRPWRRIKRWARHTPNGEIALLLVCVGITLIFIAAVIALTVL